MRYTLFFDKLRAGQLTVGYSVHTLSFPGYRIQSLLYESAQSLVYRATVVTADDRPAAGPNAVGDDSASGKTVILKQLKQNCLSPTALARFRREYAILQHLTASNSSKARGSGTPPRLETPLLRTPATEYQGLSRLGLGTSESIIQAYDLVAYDKTLVMVLEDFGGESLHKLLQGALEVDYCLLRVRVPFYTPFQLMADNKAIMGIDWHQLWQQGALQRKWMRQITTWYDEALFRPHIDRTFGLEQAAAAHHYLQERQNVGKVLLIP